MRISAATMLAAILKHTDQKIVLAESCTGGRAAALLTLEPGISRHFCGSAVTYRPETKSQWLSIDSNFIQTHTAESIETTLTMATAVLDRTTEAHWSAAVTGHLGPGAPSEKDGIVFIVIARRLSEKTDTQWQQVKLTSASRSERQHEAAEKMLSILAETIRAADR